MSQIRIRWFALLLLSPSVALAQQPPPGYAEPPPPPPPGYPVAPPPPGYAVAPVYVPPPPEPLIRVRAGVGGGPALFVPGPSYGANVSGRVGIQIKRRFGVYADFGGGLGFGGSISAGTGGGGVSVDFVDYWRLTFMGEVDFGPFFISLGVGLFDGVWGGVSEFASSSGSATQAAWVADGFFPELLGRIGVSLGRGRSKFTIAFESMLVFGKMTSVSQSASQNGAQQEVRIGNLTTGYAPALMFGWDLR